MDSFEQETFIMLITTQRGKADKIHIYIDGEYRLTVDESYWASLCIAEKSEIDEDGFIELESSIMRRRAFNKAAYLLSSREHSRREIITKLIQRGYNKETAEEAADRLEEYGYLSDERFARLYAAELKERKKLGKIRIKQELLRKGIDRDIIENVLSETEEDAETEIAELLRKKYPRFSQDERMKNRAINALIRYGYRIYDIKNAMNMFDNSEEEYYDIEE